MNERATGGFVSFEQTISNIEQTPGPTNNLVARSLKEVFYSGLYGRISTDPRPVGGDIMPKSAQLIIVDEGAFKSIDVLFVHGETNPDQETKLNDELAEHAGKVITVEGQVEFVRKMGRNMIESLQRANFITAAALIVYKEADSTETRSLVYYPYSFLTVEGVYEESRRETLALMFSSGLLKHFELPKDTDSNTGKV